MNKFVSLMAIVAFSVAAALAPGMADAKRLGGGSSFGKQRSVPATAPQRATPDSVQPTQAVPPSPASAPGAASAAAQKPGFMSRFGPILAGLGLGALLGSLFAGGVGSTLMLLLLAAIAVFLVFRLLGAGRARSAAANDAPLRSGGLEFASAGAPTAAAAYPMPAVPAGAAGAASAAAPSAATHEAMNEAMPETAEVAALMQVAEAAFMRLQAANDRCDLDDLRKSSTPEVFAELAMQVRERGSAPQTTEFGSLKAALLELTTEGDYGVMSVRYTGTVRDVPGAAPESFCEVWHLRRALSEPQANWLVAGIQQHPA